MTRHVRAGAPIVAVIGAGFSGLLTAIHLLEQHPGVVIRLVERADRFAQGRAYSTANPDHLLNVRASNMSAFPDRPDHFRDWLAAQDGAAEDAFVSRSRYGDYLQELLRDAISDTAAGRLLLEQDEAVSVRPVGRQYAVGLALGRAIVVDAVVLAIGFGRPDTPAQIPPEARDAVAYIGDPWRTDFEALPAGEVLLIGSGLTTVDLVLSAEREDRRLTVLSRHGLLPRTHGPAPISPLPAGELDSPRRVLRTLRAHSREVGWRSAVDSIRPMTPAIWRSWPQAERRRFLRHARPWWEVHRHRMAPQVAARLAAAVKAGRLAFLAGRIVSVACGPDGFTAVIRSRGRAQTEERTFQGIVNCTGPGASPTAEPLLADLVRQGLARPDPLGLGLDIDDQGRARGAPGRLYVVGPLARPSAWETVAVPDLRGQTAALAGAIGEDLRAHAEAE